MDVPPLPAGRYRISADVTQGSGYANTMTTEVDLPGMAPSRLDAPRTDALAPNPDDSWHVGNVQGGMAYDFDDGARMVWIHDGQSMTVDEPFAVRLHLEGSDGVTLPLENYMGMLSHAAVRRHDGAVFTHLDPTGTVSMAAQALFRAEGLRGRAAVRLPKPGTYRVWAQLKSGGRVDTGVFDVEAVE